MFEPTVDIEGLPELNARLDKIAAMVSGPIAREALEAGPARSSKAKRSRIVRKLTRHAGRGYYRRHPHA
jgi:hypothetical protein